MKLARILAISDIHDNIDALRDILYMVNFDMMVLAGDILELKALEFFRVISRIQKHVVMIHGNHDCHLCLDKIAKKLRFVHYIRQGWVNLEIDGEELTILGVSGIYGKEKVSPLYFEDKHLIRLVSKIQESCTKADIIVSHVPPRYCADFLPKGGRGGLEQLLTLMDLCEPKFWISGHTHVLAVEKRMKSVTINCGYGYIGDFVLIDTKKEKVVISRLFLDVVNAEKDREKDFVFAIRKTKSMRRISKLIANSISVLEEDWGSL
ncbi:MAG: metallophosphoesterase [Candidatus Korarchaeota archaeon]